MPSALETMVKILKLERDQGGKNTAVVGGLVSFVSSWQQQAREQARRAEQQILIDEIVDILKAYETWKMKTSASSRSTTSWIGRQTAHPRQKLIGIEFPSGKRSCRHAKEKVPAPERRRPRPEHSDRRGANAPRSRGHRRSYAYDSATYDEDYTGGPSTTRTDIPAMPILTRPPRLPRPQLRPDDIENLQRELEAPTTAVKGIGNKFAELLQQMHIRTVRDLLFSLPRQYRDYTELTCHQGLARKRRSTVIATITSTRIVASRWW